MKQQEEEAKVEKALKAKVPSPIRPNRRLLPYPMLNSNTARSRTRRRGRLTWVRAVPWPGAQQAKARQEAARQEAAAAAAMAATWGGGSGGRSSRLSLAEIQVGTGGGGGGGGWLLPFGGRQRAAWWLCATRRVYGRGTGPWLAKRAVPRPPQHAERRGAAAGGGGAHQGPGGPAAGGGGGGVSGLVAGL